MTCSDHLPMVEYSPAHFGAASDYIAAAANCLDKPLYAYVESGSGNDCTAKANRAAFDEWTVLPDQLASIDKIDTALEMPGLALAHPVALAPVAYQRLINGRAELATAEAAEATDSSFVAATLSSEPIESITACAGSRTAFQLYLQPSGDDTLALVERAEAAGCKALFLTIDGAVQQPSRRAISAGFHLPAQITGNNVTQIAQTCTLETAMTARVSTKHIQWLASQSQLPIYVKGVLTTADAARAMDAGRDLLGHPRPQIVTND